MSNKHDRRFKGWILYLAIILALVLASVPQVSTGVAMAAPAAGVNTPEGVVNFPANSLIIPMDTTYQNAGMWKAYGLLYKLLQNGVPVSWAIEPSKAFNGVDFTTTSVDARTNAAVNSGNPYTYKGGPFVIAAADVAVAQPIITAWWAANSNQPVMHKATAAFNAAVDIVLKKAPIIAIESDNSSIAIDYMTAAGIPAAAAPAGFGYTVIDEATIAAGGLFQQGVCSSLKYDVYVTPHNDGFSYSLTNATNLGTKAYAALDYFVYQGGGWIALCASIFSNENAINDLYRNSNPAVRALFAPAPVTGGFLTQTGIDVANKNKGSNNTWVVDPANVKLPVAQVVPTGATVKVPGGSLGSWKSPATGGTLTQYWGQTERVGYFTESALQYDNVVNGVYHNGLGKGKMTLVGGHHHDTGAYNSNEDAYFLKSIYNALFFNGAAVANLSLATVPTQVYATYATPVQLQLRNTGASIATNVSNLVITLPVGVVYNSTTGPAPDSVTGGGANPTVLTWASLGNVAASSVALTVNVTVNYATAGLYQIATYVAVYGDVFGENFTAASCQSIEALTAPLGVTLGDFSAACQAETPVISWETVSELTNQGFNLYRGLDSTTPDTQLNATMIPSQGPGSAQGFTYTWTDDTAQPGTQYYYWLEDVDFAGATHMNGPISVLCTAPTAVTLGNLDASNPSGGLLSGWLVALMLGMMLAGFVAVRRMRTNSA